MFTSIDEVTAAQKARVQTFFNIANEAVNGFEKLVHLNFQFLRDSTQRSINALANGEMPGASAIKAGDLSIVERTALYNQQVYDIVAGTQAAIVKQATAQYESQIGAVKADLEDATQRVPVGAEVAVTAMNSAFAAANELYESIWNTARQAVQTAESNFNAVTRNTKNISHAA